MNNLDSYFNQFQISKSQKDRTENQIKRHYSNGLSKYIQKLKVVTVSDMKACKNIWKSFSTNKSLFDTWEFRSLFQESFNTNFEFICLIYESTLAAALPICFDKYEREWTWFGSDWQEDNKFMAIDDIFIPLLLFLSPSPINLKGIPQKEKNRVQFVKFEDDDAKYMLDISKMKTLHDYLTQLNKKKRYNLKRDKKHIDAHKPQILFDKFENYNDINLLTHKRYSKKDLLADWEEQPELKEAFQKFIDRSGKTYKARMITCIIDNKIAAVDLLCLHDHTYYTLKGGYDIENYPGIGNYMNLIEIEDAIKLKRETMDFLQINYGWKQRWFDEHKRYKFVKNSLY